MALFAFLKPRKTSFLGRKYLSILRASIIVEAVSYIVTLTDTLVAGNMIGEKALTAVGLVAPMTVLSTFLMSVINSGVVPKYSYHIGRFDKRRANEFFSQGILLGGTLGVLFFLLFFFLKDFLVSRQNVPADLLPYVKDYYGVIVFGFLLDPVMALLDNTTVNDGGENLSAFANIFQIISNVVLSILFSRFWGVKGIAFASLLGKVLFLAIISSWFFTKKSTVRFVKHWSFRDCAEIIRAGIVRASYFALGALLAATLNTIVLSSRFDADVIVELSVVLRILDITAVFVGLSTAIQPLIGTLRGENNTKAMLGLMKAATRIMVFAGLAVSVLLVASAPLLVASFGVENPQAVSRCVTATRIVCTTLLFRSVLCLFSNYYFLIEKRKLVLLVNGIKDYLVPAGLAAAAAFALHDPDSIWISLALAPVVSALLAAGIIFLRCGRKQFPFLIPSEGMDRIFIYDTEVNEACAVKMSETVGRLLQEKGISDRIRKIVGILSEELLMMIYEKNSPARRKLSAELTIMLEETGVRFILRDSGVIFDITDTDSQIGSLRQYFVTRIMDLPERKSSLAATGYNRNEFFFAYSRPEGGNA